MDPLFAPSEGPPRADVTYADLEKVPDTLVAELIGGELIASPRPSGLHANAASLLAGLLVPPFRLKQGGPGGWHILFEPELHLGPRPDVLVPDLAGWRMERMPAVPVLSRFEVTPDWVCEILSPSTLATDRMKKMPVYKREGVRYVWLLNPADRVLDAFKLDGDRWVVVAQIGGDEKVRVEPFEAVELDLALLWAAPK